MNHDKKSVMKHRGIQFFAMQNLDAIQKSRAEILQRMTQAVQDNDQEKFAQAFGDLAQAIEQSIMSEVRAVQAGQDDSVLAARGCRVLTSEEREYYQAVIGAMRSDNPKQALSDVNKVLPETVIDAVFEDLKEQHTLLSAINFQNTGALVKILLSSSGGAAKWGAINKTITEELSASFLEVDLSLAALTAFLPVNRYMLDLGPAWMDRYVRELLTEALAVELETGIISGNGKDAPIGMMKKLTGAVDGVYADKTAVEVTALSPEAYGPLLATLSKGPNGKSRSVTSVLLAVNPEDYFTRIFPATTVRAADGTYSKDVFPFPTTVVQSAAVPAGKAVMGLPAKYFMGLGTQSGGKIEYSDEYKFLERQRIYAIFLYGYGRAMDENAFILMDISKLEGASLEVTVTDRSSASASDSGRSATSKG